MFTRGLHGGDPLAWGLKGAVKVTGEVGDTGLTGETISIGTPRPGLDEPESCYRRCKKLL